MQSSVTWLVLYRALGSCPSRDSNESRSLLPKSVLFIRYFDVWYFFHCRSPIGNGVSTRRKACLQLLAAWTNTINNFFVSSGLRVNCTGKDKTRQKSTTQSALCTLLVI